MTRHCKTKNNETFFNDNLIFYEFMSERRQPAIKQGGILIEIWNTNNSLQIYELT